MQTKIHFDLPAWKDDKTAYMREYQKMKFYCTVCDKELSLQINTNTSNDPATSKMSIN